MDSKDLEKIYTAKELSLLLGKNRNYLSQLYRKKDYEKLSDFAYEKVGGTLLFSTDKDLDLSRLLTSVNLSIRLGKNADYITHMIKKDPDFLKKVGAEYRKVGRNYIFSETSATKIESYLKNSKNQRYRDKK